VLPHKHPSPSAIPSAHAVLRREIEGLEALHQALDHRFDDAVTLLARCTGRVVVTGMGKSGHIARKIAATMASTGTPAMFVHPGEASHGDLGMITPEDTLVMLSNSGETAELHALITYAQRFSIPIVAMVRRHTSALVEAATVALVLPDIPEASPVNAPTTSTTMMLALGDALAVALLEQRGFTPEDFGVFHPGGKLGKQWVRVQDLMHTGSEVPLVSEHTPMQDVLLVMTEKRFGCAGVQDASGALAGIITDGDLRRHLRPDLLALAAHTVMTHTPITAAPRQLAAEVLGVMNAKKITSLFVVEGTQPVGILHIHDLLRAGVA
jgi:arabinose-5-phosphate isomerase